METSEIYVHYQHFILVLYSYMMMLKNKISDCSRRRGGGKWERWKKKSGVEWREKLNRMIIAYNFGDALFTNC